MVANEREDIHAELDQCIESHERANELLGRMVKDEEETNARLEAVLVGAKLLREEHEELKSIARDLGAWREAIFELEDFCSEPVRIKNMVAAADRIDHWKKWISSLLPLDS